MKRYSVKKGQFDFTPRNWWPFHSGITSKEYRVRFNGTNLYEPIDWENDYNKGSGWTYGFDVHKNSIRWCWRPAATPMHIEICLYLYENGVRIISDKTILVPVTSDVFITLKYNGAIATLGTRFYVSGLVDSISLPWNAKIKAGLLNDLYFGGTNPSPLAQYIQMK